MCPPANAAPANATAAKAAMSLILFMVWFLSSLGVMCFVRWKRQSVLQRARRGARLRSRTNPRYGALCCDGSRGDASAHDASRGAEAEMRDAQLHALTQDASEHDESPWVPFPELSLYAPCAWQEQVPLPYVASAPVPSSPSEPSPSAEDSPSEPPSPFRREHRRPRAPSSSSVLPCSLSCSFRHPRKSILALTQRQGDPPEVSDKRFRDSDSTEPNSCFGIILSKRSRAGI